jgi:hypothetical protein
MERIMIKVRVLNANVQETVEGHRKNKDKDRIKCKKKEYKSGWSKL